MLQMLRQVILLHLLPNKKLTAVALYGIKVQQEQVMVEVVQGQTEQKQVVLLHKHHNHRLQATEMLVEMVPEVVEQRVEVVVEPQLQGLMHHRQQMAAMVN